MHHKDAHKHYLHAKKSHRNDANQQIVIFYPLEQGFSTATCVDVISGLELQHSAQMRNRWLCSIECVLSCHEHNARYIQPTM